MPAERVPLGQKSEEGEEALTEVNIVEFAVGKNVVRRERKDVILFCEQVQMVRVLLSELFHEAGLGIIHFGEHNY